MARLLFRCRAEPDKAPLDRPFAAMFVVLTLSDAVPLPLYFITLVDPFPFRLRISPTMGEVINEA